MTSRSSLQNTGKAKEVSGVSTGGLTDTPACCPRWGATTAGAARHPEQTVVRLLLLARLYVALQHCPLGQIFIPAGGLCPGVTVGELRSSCASASPPVGETNDNGVTRHGRGGSSSPESQEPTRRSTRATCFPSPVRPLQARDICGSCTIGPSAATNSE